MTCSLHFVFKVIVLAYFGAQSPSSSYQTKAELIWLCTRNKYVTEVQENTLIRHDCKQTIVVRPCSIIIALHYLFQTFNHESFACIGRKRNKRQPSTYNQKKDYELAVRNDASKVAMQGFKLTDILTMHINFCFFSSDNGMFRDFLIYLFISSYPTVHG